jgi:threonylcarbamoyladenosine tRNA methylthiotransferase CDKAL1
MNIFIDVVGCTANQYDACIARYLLTYDPGYTLVDLAEDADIILLFTCTVISATEQRMISTINSYLQDGKQVIVTGCMASAQTEVIRKINPDLLCIPPDQIHQLLFHLSSEAQMRNDIEKYQQEKKFNSIFAPIAISEGCDFSCLYCITTIARGSLRSYPMSVIKRDVQSALKQGCKEIQLTAQDTASYGRDNDITLADLLFELGRIQGQYRYRVGMMNPATVLPQLQKLIKSYENEHFYKFLHLPIQSGDDGLLRTMGRMYSIDDVITIVNHFRSKYPSLTFATDVIVGFPSEKESQHEKTMEMLTQLQPDIVNITKFSARPNTKAKSMSQRIPTDIVKKRSKALTDLSAQLSLEKNKTHIGNGYRILITEHGKNNTMIGRTDSYKPVVIKESVSIGDMVRVTILDAKQTYLFGMLI